MDWSSFWSGAAAGAASTLLVGLWVWVTLADDGDDDGGYW